MNGSQPWFVAERAEALAIVYLTRHKGVEVFSNPRYIRFDLSVRIEQGAGLEPITFAIEVKGMLSRGKIPQQEKERVFPVTFDSDVTSPSDIPACTFLFTADDEQGFYRWLHEPVISTQGAEARLDPLLGQVHPNGKGQITVTSVLARLDDQAVKALITQIKDWHRVRQESKPLSRAI